MNEQDINQKINSLLSSNDEANIELGFQLIRGQRIKPNQGHVISLLKNEEYEHRNLVVRRSSFKSIVSGMAVANEGYDELCLWCLDSGHFFIFALGQDYFKRSKMYTIFSKHRHDRYECYYYTWEGQDFEDIHIFDGSIIYNTYFTREKNEHIPIEEKTEAFQQICKNLNLMRTQLELFPENNQTQQKR